MAEPCIAPNSNYMLIHKLDDHAVHQSASTVARNEGSLQEWPAPGGGWDGCDKPGALHISYGFAPDSQRFAAATATEVFLYTACGTAGSQVMRPVRAAWISHVVERRRVSTQDLAWSPDGSSIVLSHVAGSSLLQPSISSAYHEACFKAPWHLDQSAPGVRLLWGPYAFLAVPWPGGPRRASRPTNDWPAYSLLIGCHSQGAPRCATLCQGTDRAVHACLQPRRRIHCNPSSRGRCCPGV